MVTTIVATKAEELDAVVAAIHDYWFDTDRIVFDELGSTLSFAFSRPPAGATDRIIFFPRKRRAGDVESFLRIRHVRRWIIDDTEGVGSYDFNEITFDSATMVLHITTGIPIGLTIEVEKLDVSVEITDRVID
jgi:hypothetical protein